MTIFNAFITNVVAKGVPAEALQGVYSMHYFYYDLAGFEDKEVAKARPGVHEALSREIQDAAGRVCGDRLHRLHGDVPGLRDGQVLRPEAKVSAALMANKGQFNTMKGPAKWREDHAAVYKHAAFLVKGKGPKRAEARMGSLQRHGIDRRRSGHAVDEVARLLTAQNRVISDYRSPEAASARPPKRQSSLEGRSDDLCVELFAPQGPERVPGFSSTH